MVLTILLLSLVFIQRFMISALISDFNLNRKDT
jgi:hypothetical protein